MTSFDMRGQNVLKQFNADTINLFMQQADRISRIRWRKIETVNYAVREDSERFRHWFSMDVFRSLNETFDGKGYRRFTALFAPTPVSRNGQSLHMYTFHCHEIAFAVGVRKRAIDRVTLLGQLRERPVEEQKKVSDDLLHEEKLFQDSWHLSGSIDFSQSGAIEFEYDPDGKAMSIKSQEEFSLDPTDYENHIETTSEMLSYIAAAQRSVVAIMGDISFTLKNWPLLKLATRILDHEPIDIDAIRIDANDYERWDYHNPTLETELAGVRR
jgi:hypothetical protein